MHRAILQRAILQRVSILVGLACLTVAYTSPVLSATDSPYQIEKKAFKKRIKSVALAPLNVPGALTLSEDMRVYIEAQASEALNKTKLDVTEIAPYAELRALFAQQIGGLHDEAGAVDPKRQDVVWGHAKREMRMRHPVDGFAEISLRIVTAVFDDDRAEWDGVKRKVKSSGDGFFGGKNYQGNIAAVSFQLVIVDRNDEVVFSQRGGIDVAQVREGEQLVPRTDDYLSDPKSLKKAVKMAFKKL